MSISIRVTSPSQVIHNPIKYFFRLSILSTLIVCCVNAQVTNTIRIEAGWNLLSLPLKVIDGTKSSLFPTAKSQSIMYKDGYREIDTLENGYGFWLKFDSAETIIIEGESIHRDTISVQAGWNMIGSLTEIIHVNMVVTEPPGIIVSDFFNYVPQSGYEASDTIKPGVGYWVKVNQNGSIILSSGLPCPGLPTVIYAGKVYNTVKIGTQCWLKENLDVGIKINGAQEQSDSERIEKYCYDDDTANCNIYGGLYQWDEAMQYTTTEGAQGICPPGWHIPTYSEFQALSTIVGYDGNALKAIGQGTNDGIGTNTSGFSTLLSGGRDINGFFDYLFNFANFWSSTEYYSTTAVFVLLSNTGSDIDMYYQYGKGHGFSVRCLKD